MHMPRFSLMILVVGLFGLMGCCGASRRQACGPTYTPAPLVPRASIGASPLPPRFVPAPPPGAVLAPPGALPPGPAGPPQALPSANPPTTQGSYSIPIPPEPNWKPSTDAGVRLAPPEPAAAEQPRQAAKLPQAQTPEPPPASLPSPPRMPMAKDADAAPMPLPMAKDAEGTPPLPVDIPQFAQAKANVAVGQQPFPDGVAWLQANGYKTILHIHKPGEDEAAARRLFEKRGLKYLSLEVAPANLTKAVIDQFNQAIADAGNQPLFVYDRDSSLAGGLWYLHFRLSDNLSDEKARAEAGRLGFKEDRDGEHRTMWVAVQNYLKNVMGN